MESLLAGRYRAVWGSCSKAKEWAVMGGLGPSGLVSTGNTKHKYNNKNLSCLR